MAFIFGGDTGDTYESIQRKREIADAMLARSMQTPQNPWEGLSAIGHAIAGKVVERRADNAEKKQRDKASEAFANLIGGMGAPQIDAAGTPSSGPAPGMAADSWSPELIEKVIQAESAGNPNAVSPKGARGLMQIMPDTARDPGFGVPDVFTLAQDMGRPVQDQSDETLNALLADPEVNQAFGKRYLRAMVDREGGDVRRGLAAYNAGPGAVDAHGGVPPFAETQAYVDKIAPQGGSAVVAQNMPQEPQQPMEVASAAGGLDPRLIELLGNRFLTDGQRAVAQAMLQQQIGAMYPDPMDDLRRRKLEAEIVDLERPERPDDPIAALRARAQAAGLSEGTPEYAEFMRSGGRSQDKRVIYGADGQPVYAEGVDPSQVKLTEQQSKDLVYVQRAQGAAPILDEHESVLTNWDEDLASRFGTVGNYYKSDEYQKAEQAGREWLAAILRKDTGAAITSQEFDLYGPMYLPQPGDDAPVIEQKRKARKRAADAIESGLGSAQIILNEMNRRRAAEKGGDDAGAPEGVDPGVWKHMTPEERALWN